ncbi:granulocyte-macrophage colony-stimulating factor receptor subunit alpha-like [Mirounga leonina]|uniref:granulocyte-macrophage colony-stimulating factor receptor subunit alpha-like n=1 Tax=Mirounga leonina TaxID=9715 RepID=UPI00156BFD10|nr:granulocyte-macrophage colony-stimulating factor receptor subunit alpha-like [Mirounga leonina]XP_034885523.1 granulocyte-macrophage colony-stimulating factor receptor subunit alpha-like [Mirounga leonina]
MATILDLVSFLVLLNSAFRGQAQLAQENISPITNMQLDPRKRMLTWNYIRNVSQQECTYSPLNSSIMPNFTIRQIPRVKEDNTYFCIFHNCVLHRGAQLTVNVTCDGIVSQEFLLFENRGREGSGAVNFSCFIYNVRLMNCSWVPGPRAPADVRYQVFWWTSLDKDEVECVHYIMDPTGTRVGCHFDQLGEPQHMDNYFFLVNGTSNETAIPFLDFVPFEAYKMEKYDPPTNITISYNRSHHIIQWENPEIRYELSSHVLYYELDIQRAGSASKTNPVFQRGQDPNVYLMPHSAVRPDTTFRVRVRYLHNELWSEWSPTLRLGLPQQDFRGVLVEVVVAATAVLALVLMCLCKWFSVRSRLFPRIPQVKKEITGTFMPPPEVAWEGGRPPPLGSQEPEDVLMVEEMS